LPLLCLALFLLLPLPVAAPLVAFLALASFLLFKQLAGSVRVPAATGREAMLDAEVRVLQQTEDGWQVRHQGEVWSALSSEALCPGGRARIVGFEGLKLLVVADDRDGGIGGPGHELSSARLALARALARLKAQMAALDAGSRQRESAARAALPEHEEAARAYLQQKQELLASRARLAEEVARLEQELAHLETLAQAGIPRPGC
jgi:membrane protein implicated in regulation of membrane protease activity